MTSSVRYTSITNSTGAVLTTATGLIIDGKDGGLKVFRRVFAAIDVGTDAGKTRDNTNPTKGCLVCTILGSKIKEIISLSLFKPTNATNQVFNQTLFATDAHYYRYGWRISPDETSLYIFDIGDDGTTQITENDFLTVALITGNY